MREVTGRLENWYVDPVYKIYWGNIYDDVKGRFYDGQFIHTSNVVFMSRTHIETLNSYYLLGQPRSL